MPHHLVTDSLQRQGFERPFKYHGGPHIQDKHKLANSLKTTFVRFTDQMEKIEKKDDIPAVDLQED